MGYPTKITEMMLTALDQGQSKCNVPQFGNFAYILALVEFNQI